MIIDTHIYVIDDDIGVLGSIEFLFCALGIDAWVFDSADEFLSRLDSLRPGCVLMDLTLPGTSGLEVQRKMQCRNLPWPIIFMSGSPDFGEWNDARETGAVACLAKPFSQEELLTAVHRAFVSLRRSRLAGGHARTFAQQARA